MSTFGSELSTAVGYYKPNWHIEGELGFSKSVLTNLKHTELMEENFSSVKDGWFFPTGGQWFYDIRVSKTLRRNYFLSFELGVTNAQRKHVDAVLPRYVQIGLMKMF